MSWNNYIDRIISSKCDKAAIIGIDGSLWTTNNHPNNWNITASEASVIGKAVSDPNLTVFQQSGIIVDGVKYECLRAELNSDNKMVLGKKKDDGFISIQITKTAVIIAHTKEGESHGDTAVAVEQIASYLGQSGI
eukprot:CAMPEP_0172301490 /NCGR_PEP_ID=MMETSP1058-20130122/3376_1 /TAXON_ID=83371 /ORGANISM="Detonula confervacea, Strain CCMP 353" /LENGTH=134 /DNA_ID=CAMNT_0013011631 /DNA_START=78 /DNA_END=482 /DNA_ORIENTATION=-